MAPTFTTRRFRNGDFPVYRRRSDGTGGEEFVFQYTPGAFLGPSDISPDGKWLLCDAGGYLITVPLTGDAKSRKEVETLRDEFLNTIGRISPDGNFIAYRSDEVQPERGEIYVRPFKTASAETGDGKWRLSKDGVNAMLHWRADGREVFWRGLNLESNDLLVMSVDVETKRRHSASAPQSCCSGCRVRLAATSATSAATVSDLCSLSMCRLLLRPQRRADVPMACRGQVTSSA